MKSQNFSDLDMSKVRNLVRSRWYAWFQDLCLEHFYEWSRGYVHTSSL